MTRSLFQKRRSDIFILLGILLCFLPFISVGMALAIGLLVSFLGFNSNDYSKYSGWLLKNAVILMGFGMSLPVVISTAKQAFPITALSVAFTLILGIVLGKILKVDKKLSWLIAAGTAICGGSAIAAVSSVIKADKDRVSMSLIVVFILNAVALFIFPVLGHYFGLSQEVFGQWAAIAIHDTSSVVGAGVSYGERALEIGTSVKLTRTLWIIPVSLCFAFVMKGEKGKMKFPFFIIGFIISLCIVYVLPEYDTLYKVLYYLGKKGLLIALFLIGSGINVKNVKAMGLRSLIMALFLWICVSIGSLILLNYS
ncbi:MAG: YeiH family protein [Hyphomicrobiales bacterium]